MLEAIEHELVRRGYQCKRSEETIEVPAFGFRLGVNFFCAKDQTYTCHIHFCSPKSQLYTHGFCFAAWAADEDQAKAQIFERDAARKANRDLSESSMAIALLAPSAEEFGIN